MRRSRGFTLLEVLIAFAILTVSLAAVYEVLASGARRSARLSERMPALALAESLLAEHVVRPLDTPSSQSGTKGPYRWTVTIAPSPTNAPDALPVVTVTSDVSWGATADSRRVTLRELAFARHVEPAP